MDAATSGGATAIAMDSAQLLTALLLCGILGLLGQGIRAVIGLKNSKALDSSTPSQQSAFSAAYLLLSLMIGFIAGVLAGLALGLQNFASVTSDHFDLLLGVAASGYVGADFIENSLSLVIPARPQEPQPPASADPPAPAPAPVPPAPPSPAPAPATMALGLVSAPVGVDPTRFAAALAIVAPQVKAADWLPQLLAAFSRFDINTNRRAAAAIGQFLVEAGAGFTELAENLNYTHAERLVKIFPHEFPTVADAKAYVGKPEAIGNRAYANRNGNGDEASGDGYRFRGRGLIQLTGRNEYTDFGLTIGKTAEEAAAYCETIAGAAMSAGWYLNSRGCLPLADAWQISAITRRVNGAGMVGADQRLTYASDMLKHLGG